VQIDDVHRQYKTTDLLRIRVETHQRYSEAPLDLDAACAEVLGLAGDEALLDVGCGPGVFLRHLRGCGHRGRLAGLDQSTAMVAEAGRVARGAGMTIEWFTGLADALPFADGEFAVLSARHMLYHVPDIPAALGEFARVVGPGGVVFVATNGARNTRGLGALANEIAQRFGLAAAWDCIAAAEGYTEPLARYIPHENPQVNGGPRLSSGSCESRVCAVRRGHASTRATPRSGQQVADDVRPVRDLAGYV
jgi:ubiquinone/menaquinone biosynthesis C-methylase UbiE